jgi:phage/plasmid primase-like uncharacterized protein
MPWRPGRQLVRSVAVKTMTTRPDLATLAVRCQGAVAPERLAALARSLGISVESLTVLGIGWSADHRAWSFPMCDAAGNVVGIRLRKAAGFKFAVKGSKEGLFLPSTAAADSERLVVCEGPTDTAALLDLGFAGAVGRPSCTGGIPLLAELVGWRRPREVVIVADGDEPGRRGADNLASVLAVYAPAVRVIVPPDGIKDARDWLRSGADRQAVEQVIEATPARRLTMRTIEVTSGR